MTPPAKPIKKSSECIKVVFRIRPPNSKEIRAGNAVVAVAREDGGTVEVRDPRSGPTDPSVKLFTFDAVFSPESSQRALYDTCAAPVVQSVLEGYNGTVFAYGQTGAGKTHTMEGRNEPKEDRGIIPLAFQHVFDHVALKNSTEKYLVRASYFEIYNEEIRDLIEPQNRLELKESADAGVYVKNLSTFVVKSVTEIDNLMQAGKKNRSVASTLMNAGSSRSHSIFSIVVECCVAAGGASPQKDRIRVGKLNLVDLAGSERQSKTGATGDRLKEGAKINLSLSALGNVISALVDGKSGHVPYRDSKLTRILQDSLGGNTKTVMCANAGPADYNYDETISTLRYANRAKNIKNKPKVNEDPKDAMLREYQEEIAELRDKLKNIDTVAPRTGTSEDAKDSHETGNATGVADENVLQEIRQKADQEKADMQAQSEKQMERLMDQHNATAEERKALEIKLQQEGEARQEMERHRHELEQKLQQMEEKLIVGGEIATKAAKQEAALRKAEQDLIARREAELALARQMAAKEESNLELEEKHTSLNDEVKARTKKLKKVWKKFQEAKADIKDLQGEFQIERNDMLETIREFNRQLSLKDYIISNFIPEKYTKLFDDVKNGGQAKWNEEDEKWHIPRVDLSGNNAVSLRERRTAVPGSRRPQTEFARNRKKHDPSPRWRCENVIRLDLDMPVRKNARECKGPGTFARVSDILECDIDDRDGEDDVGIDGEDDFSVPGNPYLSYDDEKKNGKNADRKRDKLKRRNGKGQKDRPRTAII